MRRFYQESWQGIPFTAFSNTSFFRLADSRFYSDFYDELFRRYQSWTDLPSQWRINKTIDAGWLNAQIRLMKAFRTQPGEPFRVLSIGAGLCFMEKALLEADPDIELHINDTSTAGLRWARDLVPAERIYIGQPLEVLPASTHYDLIYLCAVDYAMPQHSFARLLERVRGLLLPGGETLCMSASLLQEYSPVGGIVNAMKIFIRGGLHYLGIRKQQLWGWRRTQREYRELYKNAGYCNIADGIVDDVSQSYWIKGQ